MKVLQIMRSYKKVKKITILINFNPLSIFICQFLAFIQLGPSGKLSVKDILISKSINI